MNSLLWQGPFVLRDYLGLLLNMEAPSWPRSGAGVYVVTRHLWQGRPTAAAHVLYAGGTGNLLERLGNLVADALGFFGHREGGKGWVGRHGGAQKLWCYCDREKVGVGDLALGWAATTVPCQWCIEGQLLDRLQPALNDRSVSRPCCCPQDSL
jgi:hypothetical protein